MKTHRSEISGPWVWVWAEEEEAVDPIDWVARMARVLRLLRERGRERPAAANSAHQTRFVGREGAERG